MQSSLEIERISQETYNVQNPILFITFIKFNTAFRVFETIKKTCPSRLYIASDGGRSPEEHQRIEVFRQKILQEVNWECEIFTLFSNTNRGCKMGPYNAITWFFKNEKQGIVLEDDCLPNISFYRFCDELLEKYKHNKQITMISGWSAFGLNPKIKENIKEDYYFSKYNHIWGWASWKKSWEAYDIHKETFDNLKSIDFDTPEEEKYWKKVAKICKENKVEAWDYPWLFHIFRTKKLCIAPKQNLVANIGFNTDEATHTKGESKFDNMKVFSQEFPLKHPQNIERNSFLDKEDFKLSFKPDPLISRIFKKIKAFFGKK